MTVDYTAPAPPEPPAPPVMEPPTTSSFARIAGVLFAPAKTFAEIARRPDIAIPLLVIIIFGYISTIVVMPYMDWSSIHEEQARQARKQNPQISDADLERMAKFAEGVGRVAGWVSPLIMVVWYLIVAGALLVAFRLMGGDGNFKQAFSVTLYAWMPLLLFGVITTVVVYLRGSFDPSQAATLVKSNPAFLVDMKEHPLLFALLSSFDLFTIWTIVLLVFGFSAISKFSLQKSAVIVLILWAVHIVIRLGFTALGVMMGGGR